jgi:hypothetical protein
LAKIGYMQLTDFQTFFGYFHVFQVVEHIKTFFEQLHSKNKIFQKNQKFHFWSIFANFSHIL